MSTQEIFRFSCMALTSFGVFLALLLFVFRRRRTRPSWRGLILVAAIVNLGGMAFAVVAENAGLQWWIYYTLPALTTLLLPPLAFRMSTREAALYLVLAFLSAPAIHFLFSFSLGWHEYMPFLPIPY